MPTPLPVVVVPSGGFPVTETAGAHPAALVSGAFAMAVTLVASGGMPLSGLTPSSYALKMDMSDFRNTMILF
ncbi:hypothetical protein ACQR1Y_12155 [Bradyrhizobium sp. HKCCYLRH3099]|uniref:hypothetical protein n=1 Tax=unclassified Bradyrhizobium TaxID=2631580 RepID=UPI003EBE73C9